MGAAGEQITVEANVEVLQTASSTLGTTVTSQQITALPLSNRNYTQLLSMAAGANVGVNNATALGKATQDISVNGADPSANNYMMDGVSIVNTNNTGSANDSGICAGIGIPNPDAIQEFKIQTSTYDASYGAHPGGNVNVVTKSGTNTFHGGAWEFFRNTDLNANPFFANALGSGKEILDQNQVGGSIGGPIKKNKVFFFADYQETRQRNGIAAGGSSTEFLFPLPSTRTAATLGAALCPTNNPGNKNYLTFLGGLDGAVACDGSNISQVAINMLNLKLPNGQYYIPGNPNGVYGPVVFSTPAIYQEHQLVVNADYIINSKNTFSARYFWTADPQSLPINGNLPGTPESLHYTNDNAVLKLTTLVSASLVNEVHASGQYNGAKGSDTTVSTPQAIGQATIVPTMTELPVTVMFNGPSLNGSLYPDNSPSDQIEYGDQVSWAHGKHTIRAGYEFQNAKWPISFAGLERGFLFYGTFADWLIGGAGNIAECLFCVRSGPNGIIHNYLENNHSAFVQDDWKISSHLTFNLGVRWEYDGTYSDKYGNLTNFWQSQIESVPLPPTAPTTSGPGLVGYVVPSNYTAHYPNPPAGVLVSGSSLPIQSGPPKDNFAPRAGFAWQPLKEGKLVIRGGVGMFYDRVGGGTFVHGLEQGYPYAVTLDYTGPNSYTSANPYPTTPLGVFASRWANFNGCQPQCLAGPAPGAISTLNTPSLTESLHTPLTRQYNLTFQYEFVRNWVLEAGFVGSSSLNLLDQYHDINGAQLASPSNPINGITTNTTANAPFRVPVLGYIPSGFQITAFDGISNYNSLQVTVRKQLSRGFLMQGSYTWSKDLSDIPGVSSGSGANSNVPTALGQQYGPVNFSHPQRFVINYSYDLPFGNHTGALGYIANGWNVSGLTTVQDGTPLTITDQNSGTVYGIGTYDNARAQMCPGFSYGQVATSGSTVSRLGGFLNTSAFANSANAATCPEPVAPNSVAAPAGPFGPSPLPTLFGNSGVGILLGPGQFNWDISIVKTTRIKERNTLIFRTEFYNTFNHPQFGNPATAISTPSTFGQITTTTVNPRLIQFALKYLF